eukprot:364318-Chlamydomonas_euryale.AAC.8
MSACRSPADALSCAPPTDALRAFLTTTPAGGGVRAPDSAAGPPADTRRLPEPARAPPTGAGDRVFASVSS